MKVAAAIFAACVSLVLGLSNPSLAGVGGMDGGGGVGVRCKAGSGAKAFELLDLHEARIKGHPSAYNPITEAEAVKLYGTLLGQLFYIPVFGSSYEVAEMEASLAKDASAAFALKDGNFASIRVVPTLPLSTDVGNFDVKPGCSLEQIAYYADNLNTLFIASNWNELDWIDRTALLTHEMIYEGERRSHIEQYGAHELQNSEDARDFVGQLFSASGVRPHGSGVPSVGRLYCRSTNWDSFAVAFDDQPGRLNFVFNDIGGRRSNYQMRVTFAHVNKRNLQDIEHAAIDEVAELKFSGPEVSPPFRVHLKKSRGTYPSLTVTRDGTRLPLADFGLECQE